MIMINLFKPTDKQPCFDKASNIVKAINRTTGRTNPLRASELLLCNERITIVNTVIDRSLYKELKYAENYMAGGLHSMLHLAPKITDIMELVEGTNKAFTVKVDLLLKSPRLFKKARMIIRCTLLKNGQSQESYFKQPETVYYENIKNIRRNFK